MTQYSAPQFSLTQSDRARPKRQKPAILWITGLSAAGKSTVANLVEVKLADFQAHTMILDGDILREGLNKGLGFSQADRTENIRRVAEVAKLMVEAGLIVLCAFISPFAAERRLARQIVGQDEFIEIFLDTPLDVCIARDPKGLYRRAQAGEIKNFTGIDQPYERPENPELHFSTGTESAQDIADQILSYLVKKSIIGPAQEI